MRLVTFPDHFEHYPLDPFFVTPHLHGAESVGCTRPWVSAKMHVVFRLSKFVRFFDHWVDLKGLLVCANNLNIS